MSLLHPLEVIEKKERLAFVCLFIDVESDLDIVISGSDVEN
jgi:hypothetical protein